MTEARAEYMRGARHVAIYCAKLVCSLCAKGEPHHSNAVDSIGGPTGRHPVRDLHPSIGGGLIECLAAPIWAVLDQVAVST